MHYVVMWRSEVADNETRMVFPFSDQGFQDACEKFRQMAYEEGRHPVLYCAGDLARNVE